MAIEIPANFNFRRTIYSHGWCELPPFQIDEEKWRLSYTFSANAPTTINERDGKILVKGAKNQKITQSLRHILMLDEDFSEFFEVLAADKRLAWIAGEKAGRMLRGPNVYEDLVKTICTTNCNWAMTKIMVKNLVEKLGEDGLFPGAEAMANASLEFYQKEIRAGYRAAYFKELAERVAEGKLDPEKWLHSDLPLKELKKEIKNVKGVGEYAADNLLKLLARFDGLALDSWLRSQFYKKHNNETPCDDKEIEKFYERYGKWKGIVIWLDMTERWL